MIYDSTHFERVESFRKDGEGPHGRFVPVPEEETGFALSLFIGAATGALAGGELVGLGAESVTRCNRLLWTLCPRKGELRREATPEHYLGSLDAAFRALWKHYEGDERQDSVCARVLGFYVLMEETKGELVEGWVSSCEESEEVVTLHSGVVATLACVPLTREGVLRRAEFRTRLEAYAM